jgi:hypothetical protein
MSTPTYWPTCAISPRKLEKTLSRVRSIKACQPRPALSADTRSSQVGVELGAAIGSMNSRRLIRA